MFLSRLKPQNDNNQKNNSDDKNLKEDLNLENFLDKRDFTGAITFLNYNECEIEENLNKLWLGYCYFHLGEYEKSFDIYKKLETVLEDEKNEKKFKWTKQKKIDFICQLKLYLAICQFLLGDYKKSKQLEIEFDNLYSKKKVENSIELNDLHFRLKIHLASKFKDEEEIKNLIKEKNETIPNQLCLASINYLNSQYQDAIDIYKKCLLEKRELNALSVYLALCYYKLDYYDVSQEVLNSYLTKFSSDSLIAINLRACNHFKLYNGRAAESELRTFIDNCSLGFYYAKDLIKHNFVVFRNGESAFQVLSGLLDVIPEARLNLAIYFLKQNDIEKAFNLMKDIKPNTPNEFILKGVVYAAFGQLAKKQNEILSADVLKKAQQFYQVVGTSASECDTIPGRQCMASCFFLMKQFDDVLLYLSSIKSYFYNDDTFNFNYGQAKLAIGNFKEAEEILCLIRNEQILNDPVYINLLIRCYIMNKKPKLAWSLYEKNESSSQSYNYLLLIANDCYKMSFFYFSAKAFDILEKIDGNVEYFEGKRGACCALFQMIIANKEPKQLISEIISLLKTSENQQTEQIIKVIKQWS